MCLLLSSPAEVCASTSVARSSMRSATCGRAPSHPYSFTVPCTSHSSLSKTFLHVSLRCRGSYPFTPLFVQLQSVIVDARDADRRDGPREHSENTCRQHRRVHTHGVDYVHAKSILQQVEHSQLRQFCKESGLEQHESKITGFPVARARIEY